MSPATLRFLGTADSKGVPRFWCACPVCAEARTAGTNRRTRSAALIRAEGQTLLLDCGPDLHAQLARLPGPLVPDAVLVSHAHNDHLLGLGDLLDHAFYAGGDVGMGTPAGQTPLVPLPIYAPAEVLPQIEDRFRYAFRRGPPVQPLPEAGLHVAGFHVRAFRVPHGANGHSHAFRLDRPGFRAAYVTDAIDLPAETARTWLTDLDLLVLGTSFADESAAVHATRSVYDVREAVALPWARAARRVYLSHLSHDVDVRAVPLPEGWAFARDGLETSL